MDTITYVATDNASMTSTRTRTVILEAAALSKTIIWNLKAPTEFNSGWERRAAIRQTP
jgi:hypothetical protein